MAEIDEEKVTALVMQGLSRAQVAQELNTTVGILKSVYRKLGLKSKNVYTSPPFICFYCGIEGTEYFNSNSSRRCKDCAYQKTLKTLHQRKRQAREYLGNKCAYCGFNTYECALDIHHLDPAHKDPQFEKHRSWSWRRLKKEIENCILLCKNCHSAIHNDLIVLDIL